MSISHFYVPKVSLSPKRCPTRVSFSTPAYNTVNFMDVASLQTHRKQPQDNLHLVETRPPLRTHPFNIAMPQETYSLLALDEDMDEDRTASTNYAPFENMLSATHLVVSLLEAHSTNINPPYAIQGGFSMQLRGGRQSTRDVDLVTGIKMRGVWEAITGEER